MNFENNARLCSVPKANRFSIPAFSVLVAYEDFATGTHALNIFDRLFPGSSELSRFSTQNVWKFDLLEIAKFREMAASEAAYADMIIISMHGRAGLPRAVKRWMDTWVLKRKYDTGALVVLLDSTKRERGVAGIEMETYLSKCAFRAEMDLFLEGCAEPVSPRKAIANEENPRTPPFAKILPLFERGSVSN